MSSTSSGSARNATTRFDVLVVGAGPAGMIAAGRAAMRGANVLAIERNSHEGKKLRITGKGRCNITNTKPLDIFMQGVHGDRHLAERALARFGHEDIARLLQGAGVPTIVERGDRVYPASGIAADVSTALREWAQAHGVTFTFGLRVERISRGGESWEVHARYPDAQPETFSALCVVLACGGMSYPGTGSDGSGYNLARALGIELTPALPALVGFVTSPRLVRGSERLLLKNVELSAYANGELLRAARGDMELTPDGLSGPIVLAMSGQLVREMARDQTVSVHLDLKPALSLEQLRARLQRDLLARAHEPMRSVARAWLPAALVPTLLRLAGIAGSISASNVREAQRERLARTMKAIRMRLLEPEGWERAVVTQGGVPASALHLDTLQARNQPGIFICGELLDIDGDSGGYNLQLAYSTGWVAGESAAAKALTGA